MNGTPGPALVRAAGDRDNWVLVGRRGGGARRSLGKVRSDNHRDEPLPVRDGGLGHSFLLPVLTSAGSFR